MLEEWFSDLKRELFGRPGPGQPKFADLQDFRCKLGGAN